MPQPDPAPAVGGQPRVHLLVEGAALLVIATVLYGRTGTSWWLFALLFLAPDLGMLGYLAGPRLGALIYNLIHNLALPALLALADLLFGVRYGVPLGLIWAAHIGFDRVLGYGLKYNAGFGFTHLGRIGKPSIA